MVGIIGVVAFITVLALSLLVTKIATVALTVTGLSEEAARFQARSAFTGTGFTTSEAEKVVSHPVRRRIIAILMIIRSAGLVTIVLSLILSLASSGGEGSIFYRLMWLVGGVVVLWALAISSKIDRFLGNVIKRALSSWTDLDTRDYASLLHLSDEYRVMEIQVQQGDWVVGKELKDCYLNEEGVTVLGITREDGSYVGVPLPSTDINADDTLILYGRSEQLQELSERRSNAAGDESHDRAVDEEKKRVQQQQRSETERKAKKQAQQNKQ